MSTPVIESISANILTALGQVTQANNFNHTLIPIRPNRNDLATVTLQQFTAVLTQDTESPADEQAQMSYEWIQTYTIWVIVQNGEGEGGSVDTIINQVRADIQKKLIEDVTRGGYAIDTILLGSSPFDDEAGFTGIAINFAVHYRVQYADPYTKL